MQIDGHGYLLENRSHDSHFAPDNKSLKGNNSHQERSTTGQEKSLFNSSKVLGFLQNHLSDKLDTKFVNSSNKLSQFSTTNSPQEIFDRLSSKLSRLQKHIEKSGLSTQDSLSEVRQRLGDGFQEIKETLKKSGALTNSLENQIDAIYSKLTSFIDSLGGQSVNESLYFENTQYSKSLNSVIQIETQDGDLVSIDISRNVNRNMEQVYYQNNNITLYSKSSSHTTQQNFNFSVIGNIDEEEKKAINELMKKIADTTDKFEKGDINASLDAAKQLNFDGDELKAFTLEISSSEQYKSTQAFMSNARIDQNDNNSNLNEYNNTYSDVIKIITEASLNTRLKHPLEAINEIFNSLFYQNELDDSSRPEELNKPSIDVSA